MVFVVGLWEIKYVLQSLGTKIAHHRQPENVAFRYNSNGKYIIYLKFLFQVDASCSDKMKVDYFHPTVRLPWTIISFVTESSQELTQSSERLGALQF